MTSTALLVRARSLVQVAHYPPRSTFGPRRLADFELVWVLRGSARWRVSRAGADNAELLLRPGTLALARPGMVDHYRWDERHPSSHAYVHFDLDAGTASPDWPLTRPFTGHHPLPALCGYLLDLAAVGEPVGRGLNDRVLGLVLDLFLDGPFPHVDGALRLPPPLLPAIDHVRQVWEDEGVRPVGVPELAAAAGVSGGHFSRRFTATFGCGPVTALELVRLGRAAVALQRSNLSISEISALHGFADPYHFSKRFAAAYELPPGRFRQREEDVDPTNPLTARGLLRLWAHLAGDFARRVEPIFHRSTPRT